MSNVTTTKNGFPVYDVTHKPKRMQNDNIRSAQVELQSVTTSSAVTEVPSVITLERAINFYESHDTGEYKNLYTQTAKWLRELLSKNIPVDAGTDIDKAQELLNKARGK